MTGIRRAGLVVVVQVFVGSVCWAGQWTYTPRLTVEETYTDNVTLAPEGQEEWDAVTQINPGISIRGDGRRVDLNFDYRLQTLFYAQDSDRNDVFHQLGGDATVELLKERFFVDGSATISQRNLFNTGRLARDNVNVTGNRTDVVTYEVSPYWRERFGGYADTELRYRFSAVDTDTRQLSDADRHEVTFSAVSGRRSPILTWGLDYRFEKQDRRDATDFEEENLEGELRYRLNRRWSLLAVAGYTDSDFTSRRDIEDGSYWSVGAAWRPNRYFAIEAGSGENNEFVTVDLDPSSRTSLDLSYRDRSVGSNPGETWDGVFVYRIRRARVGARYFEETTTTQELLLRQPVFEVTDPFGDPVDPTGQPLPSATDLPTLTDEVFVRKRFELFGGVRTGRKSDLGLSVYNEQREFEQTADQEDVVGGRIDWTWRWRRRTIFNSSLEVFRTDFGEDSVEDEADEGLLELILSQQFGRDIDGSLGYSFRKRDSSLDANSFEENRLEARVTKTF